MLQSLGRTKLRQAPLNCVQGQLSCILAMPRSLIPAPQNDPGQSQVQQGFLAPSQQSYTLMGAGPCPWEGKDLPALPHRIFEEGLEFNGCFISSCKRGLLCERSAW